MKMMCAVQVFQPHSCDLAPWDAAAFGQCVKGKRLIFIGDSTTRQQFQSLACLLGPVTAAAHGSAHWNSSSITGAQACLLGLSSYGAHGAISATCKGFADILPCMHQPGMPFHVVQFSTHCNIMPL